MPGSQLQDTHKKYGKDNAFISMKLERGLFFLNPGFKFPCMICRNAIAVNYPGGWLPLVIQPRLKVSDNNYCLPPLCKHLAFGVGLV